jgi:Cd2+/Zn2+-exporting ATPase
MTAYKISMRTAMSLDENTPNHTAPQSLKTAESKCCNQHAVKLTALGSSIHFVTGVKTDIRILQMDCPTEERLIRAKLASLTGIVSLEFKLLSRVLTVVHEAAALDNILRAIKSLGYTPEIGFTDAAIAAQPSKPKYLSLSLAAIIAFASVALVWLSVIPSWLLSRY